MLVFRPFFSQCSNESIVADTNRNGIARFQQLIVNKILLVPPDTEHDLRMFGRGVDVEVD